MIATARELCGPQEIKSQCAYLKQGNRTIYSTSLSRSQSQRSAGDSRQSHLEQGPHLFRGRQPFVLLENALLGFIVFGCAERCPGRKENVSQVFGRSLSEGGRVGGVARYCTRNRITGLLEHRIIGMGIYSNRKMQE